MILKPKLVVISELGFGRGCDGTQTLGSLCLCQCLFLSALRPDSVIIMRFPFFVQVIEVRWVWNPSALRHQIRMKGAHISEFPTNSIEVNFN